MNENLWGCAFNEECSPFSTRKQSCSGELSYVVKELSEEYGCPAVTIRLWVCTKHRDES